MNENLKPDESVEQNNQESEIVVNDFGATKDSAVVVEEADRTVLLTEDETIIIEKEPQITIAPKNRPRKVYAGMWGRTEVATVGLGLLAILAMVLLFVFVVLPAERELANNRAERDRLEEELISSRKKYGTITDTEAHVSKLIGSVENFENMHLSNVAIGKTALYQRLNSLIAGYGLINTTGPDYAPMEILGVQKAGQQSEAESGRAKFQSIFPGVYVTMTVEGSYQNLRRFIKEIETSNQFVVVTAVELEPAEGEENGANPTSVAQNPTQSQGIKNNNFGMDTIPNRGQQNQPMLMSQQPQEQIQQTKAARGKTHGETVSLRLELAAYFRRLNFQPPSEPVNTSVTIER